MLERARLGEGEGIWLRAERQTSGRGRLGRQWVAPTGNLSCSTLVRLRADDPPAHSLAFVAGIALHDALSDLGELPLMLKWPNDMLFGGVKCAGMLLERQGVSDAVVIGIGVNIAAAPKLDDRPATSLADFGLSVDAGELLLALAALFAVRLDRWRKELLATTLSAWQSRAHPVGSRLAVTSGGERLEGTFDGLDGDGALCLRLAGGAVRKVTAGDVALIG